MQEIRESSIEGLALSEDVMQMRTYLQKHPDRKILVAQNGGQNNMLASNADIVIGGGCRGGSKTFSLLLNTMNYVYSPSFRGIVFRHEKDDLSDMVDTSKDIYSEFGTYNISDMRWNFNNGGYLSFSYHGGSPEDFDTRFRGRQYAYVGIDEVTQMDYPKFKHIITCNRNAYHLRNHILATCNPDPDSWVAKFISWWVGEDGFPIPERDGVIRYCFMSGNTVDTIYWGSTREEVYQQCKQEIDSIWKPEFNQYGTPQQLFIKSVAFVEAKLSDNVQLMASDPTYLANLANQSEEQRSRDLEGNWKYKSSGEDMIHLEDMEKFYANAEQTTDGIRRASCDAAFDGGDNMVMTLWVGNHIQDIAVCRRDSRETLNFVAAKLEEWGVREENFTYDLNGIGQSFKGFFKRAVPFNNRESVEEKYKNMYGNIKSQVAYMFVQKVLDGEVSINPRLLDRKFSGKGFQNVPLGQILMKERKALRADDAAADKGFTLIKKPVMKQLVGHSPDFIESLVMKMIFDIKKKVVHRKSLNTYVSSPYGW